MTDAAGVTPIRYRAFISYSHADSVWGDWLHKALEAYRVPAKLVGMPTASAGPIPKRLYPVFRDREELPSSADLGGQIASALAASQFLIVICSPRAAQSRWVNEEILAFKRMGREDRILPIIVDGEPNAAGKPGLDPAAECFAPALRFALGPDGELSDRPFEPICADARPQGDGRQGALIKLAAGLLGVGFDALRQRDAEARRKRLIVRWSLAALVALTTIGGGAAIIVQQNRTAQEQATTLANLARDAADAEHPERAARYALAGIVRASAAPGSEGAMAAYAELRRAAATRFLRRLVKAPGNGLSAISYSPDFSRWAVWSGRLTFQLWDAEVGVMLRQIAATTTDPNLQLRAIYAKDSSRLVVTQPGGRMLILDGKTGADIAVLRSSGERLAEIAFLPGDTLLVALTDTGTAEVFDVTQQRRLVAFDVGQGPGNSARRTFAVAPVGALLAVAGPDNRADVWDIATQTRLGAGLVHGRAVNALAFFPDGIRLASGSEDGTTRIWDTSSGRELDRYELGDSHPVQAITLAPSPGRILVESSGRFDIWDYDALSPSQYVNFGEPVFARGWDDVGHVFATFASGSALMLNVNPVSLFRRFTGHEGVVTGGAFGRRATGETSFVTVADDGAIREWNPYAEGPVKRFSSEEEGLSRIAFVGGHARILVHATRGAALWDIPPSGDPVRAAAIACPDGAALELVSDDLKFGVCTVAAADGTRSRSVRDFTAGTVLREIEPDVALTPSPGGALVALHGAGSEVAVQEIATGHERFRVAMPAAPLRVGFSPDAARLIVEHDRAVTVLDAANGRILASLDLTRLPAGVATSQTPYPNTAIEAAVGTLVISLQNLNGSRGGDIIWNYLSGEVRLAGNVYAGFGGLYAAPADGAMAVMTWRSGIAVLDLPTGRLIQTQNGTPQGGRHLAVSPDGTHVATGSQDGTVHVWRLKAALRAAPEELVSDACDKILMNGLSVLSQDELRAAPFLDPVLDRDPCQPPSSVMRAAYALGIEGWTTGHYRHDPRAAAP